MENPDVARRQRTVLIAIETLDGDMGLEYMRRSLLQDMCFTLRISAQGSNRQLAVRLRKFYRENMGQN